MTYDRTAPRIDADRFEDEGCELHPSCLNCPRPVCKHDEPHSYTKLHTHARRDKRIYELRMSGVPPAEIKRAYGVSFRHIQRVMQRGGASKTAEDNADHFGDNEQPLISPLSLPQRIKARRPWPEMKVTP